MLQAYVCFAGNTWACDTLQLLWVFAATIVFKVQVFFYVVLQASGLTYIHARIFLVVLL
jgi:hypothetical protein